MKSRQIFIAILLAACSMAEAFSTTNAQSRNAGKLVVPIGYESYDSVRFSMWGLEFARQYYSESDTAGTFNTPIAAAIALVNAMGDSLYATHEGNFGWLFGGPAVIGGKRKGACSNMDSLYGFHAFFPLSDLVRSVKSRTFYPSPNGPENFHFGTGRYWRYNDVNFNSLAKWYNNSYDSNDISPYCEYPARDSFVQATYSTRNNNNTADTTVHYGDVGRVVLGYSDDRNANQLLWVNPNHFFRGTGSAETAKAFSVTLDFNIDENSIDDTLAAGKPDDLLPLMTLQVLFKSDVNSEYPSGQPILPFVPFRTASNPSAPGWYKCLEVVVTKHLYDSLISAGEYSWKCEDTLQNDSASHPWRFVQLHKIITDVPWYMQSAFQTNASDGDFPNWGQGSGAGPIATFSNPDNLVSADPSADPSKPYLEMRVLSTYRATVRIRGLDYEDTTVDKYLYRKRIAGAADSTHSRNPDGSIGGYDDSVTAEIHAYAGTVTLPMEYLFADYGPTEQAQMGALSTPMMGYMDYVAGKQHIYTHWHEQDNGDNSLQYRRFRMIFDGKPPCMFENEQSFFSTIFFPYNRVFPAEYLNQGGLSPSDSAWPSWNDKLVGLIAGRKTDANPYAAYLEYENEQSAFYIFSGQFRNSSRVALWHPNPKRFTIEGGLQGWSLTNYPIGTFNDTTGRWSSYDTATGTYKFNRQGGYDRAEGQRPTTPEETMANGFCLLAEGVGSICSPQAITFPTGGLFSGGTGVYGLAPRTLAHALAHTDTLQFVHSYNIGHEYTASPAFYVLPSGDTMWFWTNHDTSDICGDLPPFYLGYSNHWRAYRRFAERVNAIYDSTHGRNCPHPLKYMTWQDAYSNSQTAHEDAYFDSTSKAHAFLKIGTTYMVKRYTRGVANSYIDSTAYDTLVTSRQVEVGLFKDSISASLINRAAMVVNTRMWPSLRDSADLHYYNDGLDTMSQCHPVFGDIDVRKVFMRIDTNQFEASFRSKYYVVRDLWHPDTCWLVCADSNFAIYLKPGDAKFLYFEKAIAIDAAPEASVDGDGFTGNNGHRVAELMKGSKQVVTYTRGGRLYVSCPAKGRTFAGYNEHSDSDNIATGPEGYYTSSGNFIFGAIDSTTSETPSVSPGQNDTSAAISYMTDVSGVWYMKVAYRPHPDSVWKFLTYTAKSFSLDAHPVITPLGLNEWSVVGGYHGAIPGDSTWLVQFRFKSLPGAALSIEDTTPISLGSYPFDPVNNIARQTITSRPNLVHGLPARMAWSYKGNIWYRQYGFDSFNHLQLTPIECVSCNLPNCDNRNPSIATVGFWEFRAWTPGFDSTYYEADYVTFDAQGFTAGPVNLSTYVYVPTLVARRPTSGWSPFNVFRPDTTLGMHFPQVGTRSMIDYDQGFMRQGSFIPTGHDSDLVRDVWGNLSNKMEVSSFGNHLWSKNLLAEQGSNPSIPMRVDSVPSIFFLLSAIPKDYDHLVSSLNSIVFQGLLNSHSVTPVRTTNADLTGITKKLTIDAAVLFTGPAATLLCGDVGSAIRHGSLITIGPTPANPEWFSPNLGVETPATTQFPASPVVAEMHTTAFPYNALDTITLARSITIGDTASIRATFHSSHDFVKYTLCLRRCSDSACIAVLDSFTIVPVTALNPSGLIAPGYFRDSMWFGSRLGIGVTSDTGFLSVETSRSTTDTTVARTLMYYLSDSTTVRGAAKTTAQQKQSVPSSISLTVHPNPFNQTTLVEFKGEASSHTRIELYDLVGHELQSLYDSDIPASGYLAIALDAHSLPSGTYFLRATNGNETLTQRIQLIK